MKEYSKIILSIHFHSISSYQTRANRKKLDLNPNPLFVGKNSKFFIFLQEICLDFLICSQIFFFYSPTEKEKPLKDKTSAGIETKLKDTRSIGPSL